MAYNTSVQQMKFTNQYLTDNRLNQWFIEHQNNVYSAMNNPTLQNIKAVVNSAYIIYSYYFRLLIRDESVIKKYDNAFQTIQSEIKRVSKEMQKKESVTFNFDVLTTTIKLISELSKTVQEGNYFFNVNIDPKKFSNALDNIKELPGKVTE